MKPAALFYRNCLSWVQQISMFLQTLETLRVEVEQTVVEAGFEQDDEALACIKKEIDLLRKHFNETELKIFNSLKGRRYNEEKYSMCELSQEMKRGYTRLIDLECSINIVFGTAPLAS